MSDTTAGTLQCAFCGMSLDMTTQITWVPEGPACTPCLMKINHGIRSILESVLGIKEHKKIDPNVYNELLIGCGHNWKKQVHIDDRKDLEFSNLTTLDNNPDCNPDVLWDLNERPLPFQDHSFDEVHAYEVLEHIGRQGDVESFFDEFNEYYRILKPNGLLIATVPQPDSVWVWGDPGHTRTINHGTLVFLSRKNYATQLGKTAMSDYTRLLKCDFQMIHCEYRKDSFVFGLQAIK